MSNPATHADQSKAPAPLSEAELMTHVPPGSIWPLMVTIALVMIPFGQLAYLGKLTFFWQTKAPDGLQPFGLGLLLLGGGWLLFSLMGWAHQIIKEKVISHDVMQMEHDLKHFLAMFLVSEFAVFGAMFAYFYHRKIQAPEAFGPHTIQGLHFGGPLVAYATFLLITSSLTCELAHRAVEHGKLAFARIMLITTILLGIVFLGFQGYEYGELVNRGFTTAYLGDHPAASFVSLFFTSTGFHGLHVAIGLIMLFMVLFRLEMGHFRGRRQFSMVAASWYWHFVDIVWVALFITVYVVA